MRNISILLMLMVIYAFHTGCVCQMSGVTASSVPISGDDTYTVIGPVEAKAYGCNFLGILPVCEVNPAGTCVERALKQSGGNALIEVTLDSQTWLIPYLYPYWTRVKATAINLERGGAIQ